MHRLNGLTHESKTHAFLTHELDAGKSASCKLALTSIKFHLLVGSSNFSILLRHRPSSLQSCTEF